MNALLVNPYTQRWATIGATLAEAEGDTFGVGPLVHIEDEAVTVGTAPRTIHDFGGFPRELRLLFHYPALFTRSCCFHHALSTTSSATRATKSL